MTVEENSLIGGFGSAVLESLNSAGCCVPKILRLGLPDSFVEQGSRDELLKCTGLDPQGIADSVISFIGVDALVAAKA